MSLTDGGTTTRKLHVFDDCAILFNKDDSQSFEWIEWSQQDVGTLDHRIQICHDIGCVASVSNGAQHGRIGFETQKLDPVWVIIWTRHPNLAGRHKDFARLRLIGDDSGVMKCLLHM